MSKIKVNEIEAATGSTVTIPTGHSFTVTDGIPATNLSGTIADARLPTVPVSKGGTGLTSLGSAGQVVQVNSGGNALEFAAASSGKVKQFVVASASSRTTNNYDINGYGSTIGDNGNDHIAVSFTPTSATSKILVWANTVAGVGGNAIGLASIVHDTTPIGVCTVNGYSADGGGVTVCGWIASGNTNARTIRFKAVGAWSGNTIYLGSIRGDRTTSYNSIYGTMMIMEVE